MISIRPETQRDYKAIRSVVVAAFDSTEFGHDGEADLIDQLRDNYDEFMSLVAVDNDEIVGHIAFSPVSVHYENDEVHGMGLAPMAVAPDFQRKQIGKALIEYGLAELIKRGCQFVVVLGHADYYPRFGFVPASNFGISHGFSEAPQELFFLNTLDNQNPFGINASGTAFYPVEFGRQSSI